MPKGSFELPPQLPSEESSEIKEERLISSEPKLRYIDKAFTLMREAEEDPETGEKTPWLDLYKNVKPYENALELSDNIRATVRDFVEKKILKLKEDIPTIKELPDKNLLEALTNNWFEELGEKIKGERREVLLTVMAHIVKRIEMVAYRKTLENATEEDLRKIGIDPKLKNLLAQILDTSITADPLFVRFMAYSQLTPSPSEESSSVTLERPKDKKQHTLSSLFPHEAKFLANRFEVISKDDENWIDQPGGSIFKEYLRALSAFYQESDSVKAPERQKTVEDLYEKLISSGFPILITPATEGYYKEPYFDPELKVSIVTLESMKEEALFGQAQKAMADSLDVLNVSRFRDDMESQKVRSTIVIGGYGVNLIFNAVAQEKPAILLYLNEQMRSYDRNFPNFVRSIENADTEFENLIPEEKIKFLERMSRTDTILHEFGHSVYPDGSEEARRLGRRPLTIIDEVKAEIIYHPLIPSIIEKGGLDGTKEQWAIATLASSLQILKDQPPGDPYYHAAIYSLNALFENGAVVFEEGKFRVIDFEAFYEVQKLAAEELLNIYRDKKMTERKTWNWIKKKCNPNKQVKLVEEFIKKPQ